MQNTTAPRILPFQRVAICGLGLIGGSILKALRGSGHTGHVSVFDIDQALARQVCEEGFADIAAASPARFFLEHDLVILCQPVGVVVQYLREHRRQLLEGTALGIDVASVKLPVLQSLQGDGAEDVAQAALRFVPCHPIAGKATHGWGASEAGLLAGKPCILTPHEATPHAVLAQVHAFWQALGATTAVMTAATHDAVYACLSHAPQVLSYAYLHSLAQREHTKAWLDYRGSGFNGFTRLGSSDAGLWADIAVHNAAPLIEEIDHFAASLALFRQSLLQQDATQLAGFFSKARELHAMAKTVVKA